MADSKEGEFKTTLGKIIAELVQTQNHRAVGVLGGALVDDNLSLAVSTRWRVDDSEITKNAMSNLMGAGGALTFGVKIDFAYMTKMIGPQTRADLATIKDIRNKFAHRTLMNNNHKLDDIVTFDTQTITSWCNNLKVGSTLSVNVQKAGSTVKTPRVIETAKDKFLASVLAYSLALLVYANNPDEQLTALNDFLAR